MHTEHLIWLPEAESEAILLHELAILFRPFSPHRDVLISGFVCFKMLPWWAVGELYQ